jgi:hypothetical protein
LNDTERVIDNLRQNARTRPKRRTTLEHRILSFLGGKAKLSVIQNIVKDLERRGVIRFEAAKVIYKFG